MTIYQCGWLTLLSIWLITACQNPENQRPANLIPAERMSNILTEVHLAEARVSRLGLTAGDSTTMVYKHLEKQIFRKFQVDTAAYSKSYAYYAARPQQMEAIYKVVVKQIEAKMKSINPGQRPAPATSPKRLPLMPKNLVRS